MSELFQKMDRNRDGVVTIDEFIETCQKVNTPSNWCRLCSFMHNNTLSLSPAFFPQQDENIMASMQLFENVI